MDGLARMGWRWPYMKAGLTAMLAALAALYLAPSNANAESNGWKTLTTALLQPIAQDEHLPNSAIPMALATDGQGFLWIGTQNGLARWDGLRFRIFNSDPAPGSLPDSQVQTLHTDPLGRLWVGTLSAGLARYDPRTGRFISYSAGKLGLSHVGIQALADAPSGKLWVGTEAGLDELTPSTGQVRHVGVADSPQIEIRDALAAGVTALATDGGRDLWIGTQRGLLHRDLRTGAMATIHLGESGAPQVNALMLASDGRVWVGSEGQGAFVVSPGAMHAEPIPGSQKTAASRRGMRVRALLQVAPDEVWLAAYDDGLQVVDPKTLQSRHIRAGNASLFYGDQNIRALLRAPDGLVFIAANGAITRYDPRRTAFATLMGGSTPIAALTDRSSISVFQAPDHRIWTGYTSHGVDLIDPETGRVVNVAPSANGLPNVAIRTYAVAPGGDVVLGSDAGLFRTDANAKHVRHLRQPGRALDARVQALLRDGGRLWVAGRDGVWAYRIGVGDTLLPEIAVPADELTDRRVDILTRDPRGGLWIGTDNGLNHYDPDSRRVQRIVPPPGDETTPRGFISSVSYDSRGRLWVTTFGHGLSVAEPPVSGQPLRFRRLDTSEGLPNSNVNKVLEDRQGYIWASTDGGLARIDPRTLRPETFRLPEGVSISTFFYNAGLRTQDDRLLFAGRGGLELIRPELLKPVRPQARLVITEVRVRGRSLPGDPFLDLTTGSSLRIPSGGGGFEISFAALDYTAPERVQYAYRLVGSNDTWTEVDATRRLAAFTNLGPGRYRLEIRATDPSGAWPPQVLHLPVTVLPAWWQTWWFDVLEGLAACGVVLLLIRWRTAHLHSQRRALEKLVAERTHVLEDQAIELAEARARAEASAQAKTDFLANMSHEIRTPLNGVVAVADMLTRCDLPQKERDMAEIIRASGDTLQRLLSDILDMARIESGKITIETAPFHAGAMVRAVAGLMQLKCDERGVGLIVEIAPEIDQMVMGDMVRVRQVVTNLLSNAIKFTEKGEVRLTAERLSDGQACFLVADTGVGFPMAHRSKVLGRFEQADSSITRRFGGTGLGLSICCDLAVLMGGVLDCESEPGVGSRFWMQLPLAPAVAEAVLDIQTALASEGDDQPLRILLADDHPTNRKVVELMLEGGLAELTSVEDGAQALEAFRTGSFDLILMDMQMPVMDGLSAIAEIRRLELADNLARTPVVMLTANALPEHIANALAVGADLHLAKPFIASALFDAINTALSMRDDGDMAA